MVLYGIAIINKQGKSLLFRQFPNTSFPKLVEELENFPKFITAEQQHSFVELEKSRYLYIPVEDLFIVVISNIGSNIIEDMGALKLIYSLVIDLCGSGITEKKILEKSIDLLLSFDDIVNMGCRESVNLQQLKSYVEMESTDEASFMKSQRMKENEAIEIGKKKRKEIREKNKRSAKSTPEKDKEIKSVGSAMASIVAVPDLKPEHEEKEAKSKPVGKKAMNLFK